MNHLALNVKLDLLEAMVASLDTFLASDELTRVVPVRADGEMHRPAMSLGLLLDEIHALSQPDCALDDAQGKRLAQLERSLADARVARPREFADHLMRELSSQLRAWDRFVEELADDPQAAGAAPELEIERRSRIERLLEAAGSDDAIDAMRRKLEGVDRRFEGLRS